MRESVFKLFCSLSLMVSFLWWDMTCLGSESHQKDKWHSCLQQWIKTGRFGSVPLYSSYLSYLLTCNPTMPMGFKWDGGPSLVMQNSPCFCPRIWLSHPSVTGGFCKYFSVKSVAVGYNSLHYETMCYTQ